MLVTLFGIVMLVSPVQPENAELPMLVTLPGIVMLVSLLQFANAEGPMLVSFGNSCSVRNDGHEENACSPILVILSILSSGKRTSAQSDTDCISQKPSSNAL